jgi:hypothetical protein
VKGKENNRDQHHEREDREWEHEGERETEEKLRVREVEEEISSNNIGGGCWLVHWEVQ